eukprot:1646136-Prymnesium_polylepis.2
MAGITEKTLLDDEPWPIPRVCSAGDNSPAQLIAEHQQRASAKDVLLVGTSGGVGNELNIVLHGFLHAIDTGKRLVVEAQLDQSVMPYFAKSPLWSLVARNISMQRADGENWLPGSPRDSGLWNNLWRSHTHSISALISCASHALFQPNRSVAAAMAPYLKELEGSRNVIGVHLRTSDKEMAQRQHVTHRQLSQLGRRLHLQMNMREG